MVIKISQLYSQVRRSLMETEDAGTAGMTARLLLCHVTGKSKEQFLADREMYVSDDVVHATEALVSRVKAGEPLAYILGRWEFYGLELIVNSSVLIPRDDTCAVAELAINKAKELGDDIRILDLCTGSGCIGLAIASRVPGAKVTLADISNHALVVARQNVALNALTKRVTCLPVDALSAPPHFLGKFDLIVSNPPYITTQEMKELPNSVADYEPHLALHGGDDGLDFYRSIAKNYAAALKPGGYLCFEFGMDQGDDVCAILEANQYTILERTRDYNDRERAVIAQLGRKED